MVTSTTHIPSLEMLGEENSLIDFPNLKYISSQKVRALIDAKKIKELGTNQSLNTEVLIDLQPEVIIGYGLDNSNPTLDNLEKNGLKVLLNGDWNEQTPLGKAEWIKFFGALYGKQELANKIFTKIEKDYLKTLETVSYTHLDVYKRQHSRKPITTKTSKGCFQNTNLVKSISNESCYLCHDIKTFLFFGGTFFISELLK